MDVPITPRDRAIYEQLCKDYLNIKLFMQTAASGRCRPDAMAQCKRLVRNDVLSVRKLARIERMEELLALLEQRNLLSMLKMEIVTKLHGALQCADVVTATEQYRTMLDAHYPSVRRFYLEDLRHRDRRTWLEKEIEKVKLGEPEPSGERPTLTSYRATAREEIFGLLQKEIGGLWRSFGRSLNVTEPELDEIDDRYRNDLKMRIYRVLEQAERNVASDEAFCKLLDVALLSVRRRDLCGKIKKLLGS